MLKILVLPVEKLHFRPALIGIEKAENNVSGILLDFFRVHLRKELVPHTSFSSFTEKAARLKQHLADLNLRDKASPLYAYCTEKGISQQLTPEGPLSPWYFEAMKTKLFVRVIGELTLQQFLVPLIKNKLSPDGRQNMLIIGYGNAFESGGSSLHTDIDFKIICRSEDADTVSGVIDDFFEYAYELNFTERIIDLETMYVVQTMNELITLGEKKDGFAFYLDFYLANPRNMIAGEEQLASELHREISKIAKELSPSQLIKALYDNHLGRTRKLESRSTLTKPKDHKKFLEAYDKYKYQEIVDLYYIQSSLITNDNTKVSAQNWCWSLKYQGLRVIDLYKKLEYYDIFLLNGPARDKLANAHMLIKNIQAAKSDHAHFHRSRKKDFKRTASPHVFINSQDFSELYSNPDARERLLKDILQTDILLKDEYTHFTRLLKKKLTGEAGLLLFKAVEKYFQELTTEVEEQIKAPE